MGALFFKKALPHLVAVLVFVVLNVAYFSPQLSGKVVLRGDGVSNQGMAKEQRDFKKQLGEEVLWTNSMFGGMPTYQIGTGHPSNLTRYIEKASQLFFGPPIGVFNTLMVGSYLLFVLLGVNPWLSIIGAVSFGFSVNNMVLWEAGHSNKLRSIALFAPVIAGVILTLRHKFLVGGVIFALGMALNVYTNHVQMTYYLGIVLGVYVLIKAIQHIKDGEIPQLAKGGGILTFGLLLALAASTSNLWTTYEYSQDTMRGAPILKNTTAAAPTSSSEVEGLEWEYAMQWSNGVTDLLSTIIPGAVGGGSGEPVSSSSAIARSMRTKGAQIKQAPLYWGKLPFTSGPNYLGAIMIFLFVLGLVTVKGPFKWWLGIAVLLTFLLSMGKHFELLNRPIFDYLPMYSKFRAHSSILSVTALLVPLLGVVALGQIVAGKMDTKAANKGLLLAAGITGGFCLLMGLLGGALFDFANPGDATYQSQGWDIAALAETRKDLLKADAFRSFGLIAISAGLIWAFINKKVNQIVLLGGIGALTLFDVWSVGKRYLGADKFVAPAQYDAAHTLRPVDQQIFAAEGIAIDGSGSVKSNNAIGRGGYRVLDMSINTFNSSATSYYHNTIGGYHPAKLQRFQDIIDRYITRGGQGVLDMLNTKYFINRQGQLQQNPGALGNAWFVESIRKVNTPNEEIDALGTIDPANEAVVLDSEFDNYIGSFDPQKNGTISLQSYTPIHLVYNTNSNSEQLALFSEVWYGPNKGWQAYIDDQPVEHIRANYVLRALKVPAGQHKVEFKFAPKAYATGSTISLISSLLLLGALLGLFVWKGRGLKERLEAEEQLAKVKVKATPVKKTVSKTKAKRKKR
ncbi:MAG: YfhO family protein [Bacteroidota bacterium]